MKIKNTGIQILIIIGLSIFLGLISNALNPKGIPLLFDQNRLSEDKSDSLKREYMENLKDSVDGNKQNQKILTKEGYVKPQNIKLDFAKILYDQNNIFIDGRPKEEFATGHIKGAKNIPYKEFESESLEKKNEIVKNYNKDTLIVCYCGGGECEISIDLAYELAKLGFTNVKIYLGGYKEWEAQGYPTEKIN